MKKLYFVFAVLAALAIVFSCGDDDDPSTSSGQADDDDSAEAVDDDANDDTDDDVNDDADDDEDDDLNDDADDDDIPDDGDVLNGWNSECLSNAGKEEDPYTQQESYVMDFADGVLSVEHLNSCRNCEFDFEGAYEIDGAKLTITEYDVEPLAALCDCWYNVEYAVPGLEDGATYQLEIYKIDDKDGFPGDPHLIMSDTLDLTQSHHEFTLETYMCI